MNLHQLLTDQHADYEADLENPNAGLDTCPIDLDTITPACDDTDITPPCNYCGTTDRCPCINRGARFLDRW